MESNLRNIDLNLLVVFNALMEERHVTRAAGKIHLTQSAMSHALNRLRSLLDDPILVQTNRGMMPTPRARKMEAPIRKALNQISLGLSTPKFFDPKKSRKTFVIYCAEYFECIMLPRLMARLEWVAPHVSIVSEVLKPEIPEHAMIRGDVTCVVGIEGVVEPPRRFRSQPLIHEPLVCMVRKGNPRFKARLTAEEFTRATHLYHSTLGTPFTYTMVDQWLKKHKLKRKFAITTGAFLPAALIVAETDYIMLLPRRLARILAHNLDLRQVEPPRGVSGD